MSLIVHKFTGYLPCRVVIKPMDLLINIYVPEKSQQLAFEKSFKFVMYLEIFFQINWFNSKNTKIVARWNVEIT